ncbi:hypothetical protein [Vulcanisaeta thermophila]|uniref:hypothetical protein n=1 Tax=Vulcanisaeta thermophila TaxID=867917 RepID=UPI000A01EE87|nr:hypothetical protein [Vulcanisaeta thermophila]
MTRAQEVVASTLLVTMTAVLIVTIALTLNPALALTSSNTTNSTVPTNVTVTNTTCPPGLLVAVNANLYIDEEWLMRAGVNVSMSNVTGYGNVTEINGTITNSTAQTNETITTGTNITNYPLPPISPNTTLTPALLKNITNYYVSKGECLLALQFLVHLRHLVVHEFVLEKHAEILNKTLTYRLMLLNNTLTKLESQGLINTTQASEIYNLLSQLERAITSGNYTYASQLLREYESLTSNITKTYNTTQAREFTHRINHELNHYLIQIIKKSASLEDVLTQLGLLNKELDILGNITGLNITEVGELHKLFKELNTLYLKAHGNKTLEAQLLQSLKQGKNIDDVLNHLNSQIQATTHGKGKGGENNNTHGGGGNGNSSNKGGKHQ